MKTLKATYRGLIVEPEIYHYFANKIQLQKSAPFTETKIQVYKKYGYLETITPITKNNNHYRCVRCHNELQQEFIHFECARCEKICVYCRHCINMGRISSCATLLVWRGPNPKIRFKHRLDWQGQFTPAQEKAADELRASLLQGRPHLLHAVCGAGKTEILFPVIYALISKGLLVALATPRTDVVLELAPRLQAVLPDTTVHALYGGAEKQSGNPQLTITTTHQLYKFQEAFDAIIVDEADAFPYTVDVSLQRAVQKSKKYGAPIATVTATPTPQQIEQAKQHGGYSFIARRYHGFKLPVPRMSSLFGYAKKFTQQQLPHKLKLWTQQQLQTNTPFLLFFPTIEMMDQALPLLQQLHPAIEAVYAEDPIRKEKVLKLRAEEVPGLLTTTILERGITIKNVQVAVIGAESKIFTESALIQIAGRAGRNKDYPDGDVVFFHHGISVEMDTAIHQIKQLNAQQVLTTL